MKKTLFIIACVFLLLSVVDAKTPRRMPKPRQKFSGVSRSYTDVKMAVYETSQIGVINNNYAILINGGGTRSSSHVEYYNDIKRMYNLLLAQGWEKDNIYVYSADGLDPADDSQMQYHFWIGSRYSSPYGAVNTNPDLDGDGLSDVRDSALEVNIEAGIADIASKSNAGSLILFYTTSHGCVDTGNYDPYLDHGIRLWTDTNGWSTWWYGPEMANDLAVITKYRAKVFMIGTCYAAGLFDDLEKPSSIILACTDRQEVAHSVHEQIYIGGEYDGDTVTGFSAWLEALHEGIEDNNETMKDLFDYAEENIYFGPLLAGWGVVVFPDRDEQHPQLSDISNIASDVTLSGVIVEGDLNWDGMLSSADRRYMVNEIGKTEQEDDFPRWCDLDGNGEISQEDMVLELYHLGDVNRDGIIDTSDKLEMNRYLNSIPTTVPAERLDLTQDGVVDTSDKLVINRILNSI